MSDYNWCHGPKCHKRQTTTRVRGVKDSKVLRTIKFAVNEYRANSIFKYFCDQTCMHDFIRKHIEEFVQLHPRTECLETPIEVEVVKHPEHTTEYGWTQRAWTEKKITKVDNA